MPSGDLFPSELAFQCIQNQVIWSFLQKVMAETVSKGAAVQEPRGRDFIALSHTYEDLRGWFRRSSKLQSCSQQKEEPACQISEKRELHNMINTSPFWFKVVSKWVWSREEAESREWDPHVPWPWYVWLVLCSKMGFEVCRFVFSKKKSIHGGTHGTCTPNFMLFCLISAPFL